MRLSLCLAGLLALLSVGAAAAEADPEAGTVAAGRFDNAYFGLSYKLPEGWKEDRAGPNPSRNGAYVLTALIAEPPAKATLQFGAQDLFFDPAAPASALAAAHALQAGLAKIDGMTVDKDAAELTIAGQAFARLDYSGAGLHHAYLATMLRCHLVSATATATDQAVLEQLVASLDRLAVAIQGAPACVKDYAGPATVLHQVEPTLTGAKFVPIPVRVVIGPDGTVRHIHVINARPEQRTAIETAVKTWQFQPYRQGNEAAAVETGLTFEVK
jgi:hypothetical protein